MPPTLCCQLTLPYSAIGIVAVVVPGSFYLLNSRQDHIQHNDHEGQKGIHTKLTHVEKSKKAGVGGKLHGIDDVVTTKAEDVEHHLPADALNHPVNREKVRKDQRRKNADFMGRKDVRIYVLIVYSIGLDRGDDADEATDKTSGPDQECQGLNS